MDKIIEKIKEIYKKITRTHVMIAMSALAVIFLILAGVSAYHNKQLRETYESEILVAETQKPSAAPKDTKEPTTVPTEASTEKPLAGTDSTSPTKNNSNSNSTSSSSDAGRVDTTSSGRIQQAYTEQPSSYASYKEAYKITLAHTDLGVTSYAKYCLYDMNGDGVEELIIKCGESETQCQIIVYSYVNGQVALMGDTFGSFGYIYGNTEGGVTVYYRRDGAESIDNLYIEGNELIVSTIVPIAMVDTYTQYETSVELPMYAITDTSPLN